MKKAMYFFKWKEENVKNNNYGYNYYNNHISGVLTFDIFDFSPYIYHI